MRNTILKTFLVGSALTINPILTQAQTAGDIQLAKAQLWAAQDAYDSGDYENALKKVEAAEETMGSAGAPTLLLKAKLLYEIGRYGDAKLATSQFYKFNPSETMQREMAPILLSINEKLEAEREINAQIQAARAETERLAPLIASETEKKAGLLRSNPFTELGLLKRHGAAGQSGREGESGRRGSVGDWGSSSRAIPGISASIRRSAYNNDGEEGEQGSDGSDGSRGRQGGRIRLNIREIPMEYTAPLGFLEVLDTNGGEVVASGYWDFENSLEVSVSGGNGGRGGQGGRGGRGGSGADGSSNSNRSPRAGNGGDGGQGGNGGDGGRGGQGGSIEITLIGSDDFKSKLDKVFTPDVNGGAGGSKGDAGRGGAGGKGGEHASGRRAYSGDEGPRGRSGSSGSNGAIGSLTYNRQTLQDYNAAKGAMEKEVMRSTSPSDHMSVPSAVVAEASDSNYFFPNFLCSTQTKMTDSEGYDRAHEVWVYVTPELIHERERESETAFGSKIHPKLRAALKEIIKGKPRIQEGGHIICMGGYIESGKMPYAQSFLKNWRIAIVSEDVVPQHREVHFIDID